MVNGWKFKQIPLLIIMFFMGHILFKNMLYKFQKSFKIFSSKYFIKFWKKIGFFGDNDNIKFYFSGFLYFILNNNFNASNPNIFVYSVA